MPEVLFGHSFGGKVVVSMAEQLAASARACRAPCRARAPGPCGLAVQDQNSCYLMACPAPHVGAPYSNSCALADQLMAVDDERHHALPCCGCSFPGTINK